MVSHTRVFAALIALAAVAVPSGSFAQSTAPDATPSYARPADETIHGRVSSFDGAYSLQVHDDRGYIDNVQLAQGTVINPTGTRLEPGMLVTIRGVNRGKAFAATEIDTAYQTYGATYAEVPVGPYIYPAYPVYPYPVYPYPVYGFPYEPGFAIGIGFGGGFRGRGFRR